ncbi:MAG: 4-alpha-glucanotransferase [Oscillospiraceae bacterium]|nr:4-alpha-glucanotransferase [Oscillospiraceae bacterium]
MATTKKKKLHERGAGVLLPISSLPSNYGIGTLGEEAYRFVDFLNSAGQKYWQVLPVGPTSYGDSPYQSFSAFAGNPYFIDLDQLIEMGLLKKRDVTSVVWQDSCTSVRYDLLFQNRFSVLKKAFHNSRHQETESYRMFCEMNASWLEDYSLFMALKVYFHNKPWSDWPKDIRERQAQALHRYESLLKDDVAFWKFCQYMFYSQWDDLLRYAHEKGVQIIGDVPIYVAMDSADVWANPHLFQLDKKLRPKKVAGVPPDDFSADGQLWGNPLYDWKVMEQDGFAWWKQRMTYASRLYDFIRIDHFIGIVRYFSIPAKDKTAVNGVYKKGPGKKLTDAINSVIDSGRIIAEDLGVVVDSVVKLREQNDYPGMKVMEFGFNGDPNNDHFPENYTENTVVYGGTHDNETILGYFQNQNEWVQNYTMAYLKVKQLKQIPWAMVKKAYQSVARTVIFQAQDLLCLDNSARMNFPSTLGGNWRWRLRKRQLGKGVADRLRKLAEKEHRI